MRTVQQRLGQMARHQRMSQSSAAAPPASQRPTLRRNRAPRSVLAASLLQICNCQPLLLMCLGYIVIADQCGSVLRNGVLQVTILERQAEAGRKILVSGGTRWCAPKPISLSSSLQHCVFTTKELVTVKQR